MNHFLPQFSFCNSEDWGLNDGQGGQLTPRAVPRLRGGLPWREEADFDTFYMAFRFDLGGVVFVGGGVGYGKGTCQKRFSGIRPLRGGGGTPLFR